MTSHRDALACGALLLVLGAAPSAGHAQPFLPPEQQEVWADQLADAQERVQRAERRAEQAEEAYSEARHDQYPRGDALARIEQELEDARRERSDAREALARLVEQADDAGVLPGVLRPYR